MRSMEGQLAVVPRAVVAKSYYNLAIRCALHQSTLNALHYMVEAFTARFGESGCGDALWIDFYKGQFKKYLMGKRRICCSIPEGDMIHDFLWDCYNRLLEEVGDSEIPFKGNLRDFLEAQKVDFPYLDLDGESF